MFYWISFLHIVGSWKKCKVEVNDKSTASVITTLIHLIPHSVNIERFQNISDLSPKMWIDFSEPSKREPVREMLAADRIQNIQVGFFKN